MALRLGSCLLLILRQGGMEPLILLPHLVGTGRLVSQMSVGTQVPQVRRAVPTAKCWWRSRLRPDGISRLCFQTILAAFWFGYIFLTCAREERRRENGRQASRTMEEGSLSDVVTHCGEAGKKKDHSEIIKFLFR